MKIEQSELLWGKEASTSELLNIQSFDLNPHSAIDYYAVNEKSTTLITKTNKIC
jgi:hypothetical protein